MGTALVEFLLLSGGLYLIWRGGLKLWKWADIKQKEEDLSIIGRQQAEIDRIKKSYPVDSESAREKLSKFVKQ